MLRASLLLAVASVCACSSMPGEHADDPAGQTICYRGRKHVAERSGDDFVIEGDILVAPSDRWCDPSEPSSDDLGTSAEAVRIQGSSFKWPNGVIPYEFDSTVNVTQQGKIVAAMEHWESKVP